jgi:hypothetical protein
MRTKRAVGCVVAILLLAGAGLWAQAQRPAAPVAACALDGKGDFSPGWTERTQTASYRCVEVFDASLKPAGAAWVKVESIAPASPR